jgi:hypothetical protein
LASHNGYHRFSAVSLTIFFGRLSCNSIRSRSEYGSGSRRPVAGNNRRAGRSAFITAFPASVSRTTGRSPVENSTHPAVTHRRNSLSSHSSPCSRSTPE